MVVCIYGNVCLLQELLLPTPTNLNPIHVPGSDLLQFLRVQQWIQQHLGTNLPLLNGMFVLVPTAHLQQQQEEQGSIGSALAASIPWRLRQMVGVQVAPGDDPADATVVLVGGDRVRAGAVHQGILVDVQEYQVGQPYTYGSSA